MAQREGSIYLYLFIAASVLFLGMTVLFFVTNAEKDDVIAQRDGQKSRLSQQENELKKLAEDVRAWKELVAGPNAADAQPSFYLEEELRKKAAPAINEAMTDLGQAPRSYDTLVAPYADLQGLLLKYRQARDEAFQKRDAAGKAETDTKKQADDAIASLREEHKKALEQVADIQARFEDLDNKFKTEKAEWVKELERAKDDCSDKLIALGRQNNFKDNTIANLLSRIERLEEEVNKEKTIEDVEPDGKIVSVLSSSGKGWINLGRVNHLRKGIVFRVFQYIKGGKKGYKGTVEVQRVDENMSEVRVLQEDDLNPIVGGDFISSPFYDPKAEPVFVFAGTELESKDVTKDYIVAKMKAYGAKVDDKVNLDTDFIVAVKNYESTPEYKAARELSVTIIRERDLLEYIGR
jgi:hypothetical protein